MAPKPARSAPQRTLPPSTRQAAPAKPAVQLSLAHAQRGRANAPLRILVYGDAGVGKTTFAGAAPSPIFICAEDGAGELDVTRFVFDHETQRTRPESFAELLAALRVIESDRHDFRTLVIDTLDAIEPLVWTELLRREGKGNKHIDEWGGGYNKGQRAAVNVWQEMISALDRIRGKRGMTVILLDHACVSKFKNPEAQDFGRWTPKIEANASALVVGWCDDVLFARLEITVATDGKGRNAKGVSTGTRQLQTQGDAWFLAKNRHHLPEVLPLDYAEFEAAVAAGRASGGSASDVEEERGDDEAPAEEGPAEALRREIDEGLAELSEEHREMALASLGRSGGELTKLKQINNWVKANRKGV